MQTRATSAAPLWPRGWGRNMKKGNLYFQDLTRRERGAPFSLLTPRNCSNITAEVTIWDM